MAAPLSIRTFAKFVGVKHPSVIKAIQTGRLVDGGGGVDPEHPLSVAFAELAALRCRAKGWVPTQWEREHDPKVAADYAQAQEAKRAAVPPAVQATDRARSSGPNFPGRSPVSRENDRASSHTDGAALKNEILKTKVARDKKAEWREDRKTHSSALVRAVFGEGAAAIEENFGTFAERIADQLAAMAGKPELRTPFAEFVGAEIGKARKSVVKQLKISTEKICAEADDGLD